MRDKWYSDNRDLIKWSVLLLLARRAGVDRIIEIALLNPSDFGQDRDMTVNHIKYLRKCCPISATCETSPGFLGTRRALSSIALSETETVIFAQH